MMKPKAPTLHEEGLLEYLEDIIGSNRYVEATEEAERQVEGLNEQRTEKVMGFGEGGMGIATQPAGC